jgi:hypothetical protein
VSSSPLRCSCPPSASAALNRHHPSPACTRCT